MEAVIDKVELVQMMHERLNLLSEDRELIAYMGCKIPPGVRLRNPEFPATSLVLSSNNAIYYIVFSHQQSIQVNFRFILQQQQQCGNW